MIVGMIVSIPFGMIDFSSVATAQVFALPKLMPYALEFDPEVCITLASCSPWLPSRLSAMSPPLPGLHRPHAHRARALRRHRVSGPHFYGRRPAGRSSHQRPWPERGHHLLQQGRQQVGLCDHRVRLCHRRPVPAAFCRALRYPAARHRRRDRRRLWHHHHERRAHVHPRGLTQRTTTIVGTSVVFGLGIWMASGCLAGEGMPTWVSTVIGSNAVTPTAIMAIVLNLILPQTPVVAQHIDAAKDDAVDLVLPESKK